MTDVPIARFRRWFRKAGEAGEALPEAMALATADARGRPAVRFVLLKGVDQRGFVFFTNAGSRKGRELRDNPQASLAVYWDKLGKQVRIDGRIESVTAAEADAYWATRPRESQLAAVASRQSSELVSRAQLLAAWRKLRHHYRGEAIPRPSGWTGYRIIASEIEFWHRGDHRLHHRELFTRTRNSWSCKLLQP
ncbi:MAG: pyridoxamine 5'-phosphate oxidase [Deltaproteobacteria bacterium]|nr:pyridoxamine 5'-phosphate oxidase [Deltaproteobacteria bacterium]